ncbi:MAG TPA: DNA gyrase inhibitor YacG [Polyangia bacterium]|nr:DNA gyrase inhibitor YacG [Polyangia bacterium]
MATRKCPTCRKSIDESTGGRAFHPFCSERCRSADLSNWLNAAYRISVPVEEDEMDSGLPEGMPRGGSSSRDPDVN